MKQDKFKFNTTKVMDALNHSSELAIRRINAYIRSAAIKCYIPRDTGTLEKSIRTGITKSGGVMTGYVGSSLHYAKKQHDAELRHIGKPKSITTDKVITDSNSVRYASKYLENPFLYIQAKMAGLFKNQLNEDFFKK